MLSRSLLGTDAPLGEACVDALEGARDPLGEVVAHGGLSLGVCTGIRLSLTAVRLSERPPAFDQARQVPMLGTQHA